MDQGRSAEARTDARLDLARRIADSSYFSRSPKLRAFLLYVCENAVAGSPDNVREQLIGSRVFGRPSEYNSAEDNIVRVEARELRRRLEAYFAAEGRDEPIIIEIPRGSYMPVFRERATVVQPFPPDASQPREPARTRRWTAAAGAAVLLVAIAWLAIDDRRLRSQFPPAHPETAAVYGDLLGSLGTSAERETLVVLSNPPVIIYSGSRTDVHPKPGENVIAAPKELKSAFGYAVRSASGDYPFQFLRMTREDYTGMGEAIAAFDMGRLMESLHRPVRLTQSRFLNWEHVPKQDLIVLGGPASNDWTYQNGAQSTFNFEADGIEDRDPRPGEVRHYTAHADPGNKAATEYAVLKMLQSPYGFRTLLLAGTSSTGTAGAAQFFTDPALMTTVWTGLRGGSPKFPAEWEVLVRVLERDSIPVQVSAVAWRPAGKTH